MRKRALLSVLLIGLLASCGATPAATVPAATEILPRPCELASVVLGIAFSPDGRILATGSADGATHLWYTDINDSIADLCSRMLRDLTPEERAQYGAGNEATCPLQLGR